MMATREPDATKSIHSSFAKRPVYLLEGAVAYAHRVKPEILLTVKHLIEYAVMGKIKLLTQVPPDYKLIQCDPDSNGNVSPFTLIGYHMVKESKPKFLELSQDDCVQIQVYKKILQSDFENGFTLFKDTLSPTPPKTGMKWRVCDDPIRTPITSHHDDGSHRVNVIVSNPKNITITKDNALISHENLDQLLREINHINELTKLRDKLFCITKNATSDSAPKVAYSLVKVAAENKVEPEKLLLRALHRNIELLIFVPLDVDVSASQFCSNYYGDEYTRKPVLLALRKLDCDNIYHGQIDNKKFLLSEFYAGYILENSGRIKKVFATDEKYQLENGVHWGTFQYGETKNLELTAKDLIVKHSDLAKLLRPEPLYFEMPLNAQDLLTSDHYYSLEMAVKHVLPRHSECTANHLLRFGELNELEFITFLPVGFILRKDRGLKEPDKTSTNSDDTPELLALTGSDCEKIRLYGKTQRNCFTRGYPCDPNIGECNYLTDDSTDMNRFGYSPRVISATESDPWLTYYDSTLHEIELTPSRLFVMSSDLKRVIRGLHDLWISIDKELKECAEIKREEEIANMKKADSPQSSTEIGTAKSENAGGNANTDRLKSKPEDSAATTESNGQQLTGKNDIYSEAPAKSPTFISEKEVIERTKLSRSTINEVQSLKSKYYDPTFPKKRNIAARRIGYIESEVENWIATRGQG